MDLAALLISWVKKADAQSATAASCSLSEDELCICTPAESTVCAQLPCKYNAQSRGQHPQPSKTSLCCTSRA